MEVRKFRKRPVVIEAMQLTDGLSSDAIGRWMREHSPHALHSCGNAGGQWLRIETPEGIMNAKAGDWIIRGVAGEFYPCKPDIFEATYEPAGELPHGE